MHRYKRIINGEKIKILAIEQFNICVGRDRVDMYQLCLVELSSTVSPFLGETRKLTHSIIGSGEDLARLKMKCKRERYI